MERSSLSLKILLLTHSFNSLSQRLFVDLREAGHEVSVELDINDTVTTEAVTLFQPDLLIAPFLKRAIPESIWGQLPCLILHPGPPGDRGPSALDWAILNQEREWGVTLLQANGVMDGGDIWGYETFPLRNATKSSLYRREVTEAASRITLQAVNQFSSQTHSPTPQSELPLAAHYGEQPLMRQSDRSIDWLQDDQETVLRKIYSGDGSPGLLDHFSGRDLYLYDAHPANLCGDPGTLIGHSGSALCRAAADGQGVWIGHLCDKQSGHPFKLPATQHLSESTIDVAEVDDGYRKISYEEVDGVGLLHFNFYNGAMSSERCRQLQTALQQAKQQNTCAIMLLGGPEYWSNGMNLNQIEAADSPADASWENINAMDDLALEIINTPNHLTISLLQGNAAAGGVFLARAADQLWARSGVILNPHYKDMGNLYGSEYWSYLLPRYCGAKHAEQITQSRLPMGTAEALALGLLDRQLDQPHQTLIQHALTSVQELIHSAGFEQQLAEKQQQRTADETIRPLADYRQSELEQMRMNFYGFDPSYHIARYNFVHKVAKSRTPITLAQHRRKMQ